VEYYVLMLRNMWVGIHRPLMRSLSWVLTQLDIERRKSAVVIAFLNYGCLSELLLTLLYH